MNTATVKAPRVFIPYMSDHALAVAGTMRHMGIDAEVLPPSSRESMEIGLDLCRGRECLPCFLCVGDMLLKCRQPGFDHTSAVFFMPTGPGPCRFGQYNVLQQSILAEQGFPGARLVSPSTDDSYSLFGDDPVRLRKLAWQAIVAVDLLCKVLHEHRPYEVERSQTDALYEACLKRVVLAAEAGGGDHLVDALRWAAGRFASLAVDRRESKPLVAVIGELYLMLNARSNLEIVRSVEAAGGEVLLGTFMDWLYFVDWRRRDLSLRFGHYGEALKAMASDAYQHHIERRFLKALKPVLRHRPEPPIPQSMKGLNGTYEPALGTEATLTMARTLDAAHQGAAGIINVLPFSCMPGTLVSSMAPRLRERMQGIPWLDVSFDGQEETNIRTRLEAFMHQALQFHRRVVLPRRCASPLDAQTGVARHVRKGTPEPLLPT
jgi:predicted nucleotide-binding protein (sugar kinase/HSP70/actin superfamily)